MSTPQRSRLFRLVALISRLQLTSLVQSGTSRRDRLYLGLYVLLQACFALGTIAYVAAISGMPMLFPPLGPSAFILFYTPLAPTAAPRTVLGAHAMGLLAGVGCLHAVHWVTGADTVFDPVVFDTPSVWAVVSSLGACSVMMMALHCPHPPAAATALLGGMGILDTPFHCLGLMVAISCLVVQAFVFNRLAGLPYPLWKPRPDLEAQFSRLFGGMDTRRSFWSRRLNEML